MPTYEYRCRSCGEPLEVVQSFTDDPLTECPACGGELRKVFQSVGIAFKGRGFYKTDSRTAAKSSSSSSGSASESSGSSDVEATSSGSNGRSAARARRGRVLVLDVGHRPRLVVVLLVVDRGHQRQVTEAAAAARRADVGVFGGSGLYSLLEDVDEVAVDTPFGPTVRAGDDRLGGRPAGGVPPRHGRDHSLPPHRVPYRANAWALWQLGVRAVFAPCASGSLQPEIRRGDFVVVDQIVDRTSGRDATFHDGPGTPDGLAPVDHVSFAGPYDARLRAVAVEACRAEGVAVHDGGTVVVINGPRFSTRAESRWYAAQGWHVVNMTQMPEAVLAAEATSPTPPSP